VVQIYGAEAGNMALRTVAFGGVYVAAASHQKSCRNFEMAVSFALFAARASSQGVGAGPILGCRERGCSGVGAAYQALTVATANNF